MKKSMMGAVTDPLAWRLAWRDTRNQRRRLGLFMAAIVLGVAALVAIESFGLNVMQAIEEQAKSLTGADLTVRGREKFSERTVETLESLPATERGREWRLATMAYVPSTEASRFIQLRALEGGFPWYGELESVPAEAQATFRTGRQALLHESLLYQLDVQVGDTIRIGEAEFTVAGALRRVPGERGNFAALAPPVYIPMSELAATELVQPGSRVRYREYLMFDSPESLAAAVTTLEAIEDEERLRIRTVESRKEDFGEDMENMYRYLGLVGFLALLLGGIGVGSSVHVYMRDKISTVATLRCLGMTPRQAFAVYLIQATMMGLGGSAVGVAVGVAVQYTLPILFASALPVELTVRPAWGAMALGLAVGTAVTVAFSLLPLLTVRRVSPLLALRADIEPPKMGWRDPARLGVYAVLAGLVIGMALRQSDRWWRGLAAAAGVFIALALLVGLAKLLMWAVRKWFPQRWPYVWRQGLNNLYRPNNQTVTLMLCLGLGACLIMTLYLAQTSLMAQLARSDANGRVNMVLFDVQTDQVEALEALVQEQGLPLIQTVPMVSMRLESLKGEPVATVRERWKNDPAIDGTWQLDREYRSTYRDHTTASETVIAGEYVTELPADFDLDAQAVPVSAEREIAEELGLAMGDELVFDVQGIPIRCVIASIREVDWMRLETNFFFVFPAGVLEPAPQTIAILTRVEDARESAALQRAAVAAFSNVSIVDLALLLETVESILERIAFAIRFMALFSIATGLVVLIGSVTTSRYHLIRESMLLRTLGASRRQIQSILLIEYLFLGSFAAVAGILLSVGAAWSVVTFVFETDFILSPWPILVAWGVVTGLTLITGVLNNLDVLRKPPLAVIRAEA